MYNRPKKQRITLSLDATIIEALRELADDQFRSVSQCVNLILRQYLSRFSKKQASAAQPCETANLQHRR